MPLARLLFTCFATIILAMPHNGYAAVPKMKIIVTGQTVAIDNDLAGTVIVKLAAVDAVSGSPVAATFAQTSPYFAIAGANLITAWAGTISPVPVNLQVGAVASGYQAATAYVSINVLSPVGGPPPVVKLSTFSGTIQRGQMTAVSWMDSNATECSGGPAPFAPSGVSGIATVAPTTTTTYLMTCSGPGGDTTATLTLNVD